jgi:hypothetical protein
MKLLTNVLGSVALAAAVAAGSAGCVFRAQGHVGGPVVEVYDDPPPPRVRVVETRSGHVWVEGRWTRSGNQWVWRDGYWERERAGYTWEQGRWERRGRGNVWVEGRWVGGGGRNNGNNGHVRDHRSEPPPPPRPVVRDHR